MRRLSLNQLVAGQKSGQNIPKNRCRTTIAERMVETPAELPFIGDQVVCLSHDQAARSLPTPNYGAVNGVGSFRIPRTVLPGWLMPDKVMLQAGPPYSPLMEPPATR